MHNSTSRLGDCSTRGRSAGPPVIFAQEETVAGEEHALASRRAIGQRPLRFCLVRPSQPSTQALTTSCSTRALPVNSPIPLWSKPSAVSATAVRFGRAPGYPLVLIPGPSYLVRQPLTRLLDEIESPGDHAAP